MPLHLGVGAGGTYWKSMASGIGAKGQVFLGDIEYARSHTLVTAAPIWRLQNRLPNDAVAVFDLGQQAF